MTTLRERLGDWLDGPLTDSQETWVEEHLETYLDMWRDMFDVQLQQEEYDQANSNADIPEDIQLLWEETWG